MFRFLIVFSLIFNEITSDCLYPLWKKRCQKYCIDNQFYQIEVNQCYSNNTNQLTWKCSGKYLTEQIQTILENSLSKNSSSLITSSTVPLTIIGNVTCIPRHLCAIGKLICNGMDGYWTCHNGSWIRIGCPKGSICQREGAMVSCQIASSVAEDS